MMSAPHDHNERDRGFTLIELLVVIIIIGILAAIAIPVYLGQRKKGVDSTLRADLRNAAIAAELIATDDPNSTTPFTMPDLAAVGYKYATGNNITIVGSPGSGYRVCGWNSRATSAVASNAQMVYNSLAGGMQAGVAATC